MEGIYLIRNNINGHVYIGQSVNMEQRWKQHLYACKSGKHSLLYKAMRKDGIENFSFRPLEATDDLDERERYWIETYKAKGAIVYNYKEGGQGYSIIKKDKDYISPCDRRTYNQLQKAKERLNAEIQ